jgi:DNA-3-methyladenine glycosylase I
MRDYHDREWGVPIHDDRQLFELLVLEGAQAGLSWSTILNKREGYREAFRGCDPEAVARFDAADIERLLSSAPIVRNRAKIQATVDNARSLLALTAEMGSFDRYLWSFVGGKPLQNAWPALEALPAQTDESRAMSADLRRRGFKFVGPTICYAFMQSAGLVNDHIVSCYRYAQLLSS